MDKLNRIAQDFLSDLQKRCEFERSTPWVLVKRYRGGYITVNRMGELKIIRGFSWTDKQKKDVFRTHSEIFEFNTGVYKQPYAKIPLKDFDKRLNKIDDQIKILQEKRKELLKEEWKKSKRPLRISDLEPYENK